MTRHPMTLIQHFEMKDGGFHARAAETGEVLHFYPNGMGALIYRLPHTTALLAPFKFPALPKAVARFAHAAGGQAWHLHDRVLPPTVKTDCPLDRYLVFRLPGSPLDLIAFHPGVRSIKHAALLLATNPALVCVVLPRREVFGSRFRGAAVLERIPAIP